MPPKKTKTEIRRLATSAAMKKYKNFSAIQLGKELNKLQKQFKTDPAEGTKIKIAVVKKLISKLDDKEISATEARKELKKKVPAKKQVTKKEFEKARKDLKDKKESKPAPRNLSTSELRKLATEDYKKEYAKFSLEKLVEEMKKLNSKENRKKMSSMEIVLRVDVVRDKIGEATDEEIDALEKKAKVEKQKLNMMSYQTRAKRVFEDHKRYFGKPHYAQVEVSGYGTLNWDGYNLYEKGLTSRGDKVGTYQNDKNLDIWRDFGTAQAFTKFDPLELSRSAKGLKLN